MSIMLAAMKGYDSADSKSSVSEGVQTLNKLAQEKGYTDYLSASWEHDRIEMLKSIEALVLPNGSG